MSDPMRRWLLLAAFAFGIAAIAPVSRPALAQSTFTAEAANRYVGARDWSGLLRYSSAWTKTQPKDPMGWFYLGNTYGIGLKDPGQALPAFEHAVSLKSAWPEAWNALGHVLVQLQRNDDAADAFSHAVTLAPKRTNYWNSLAAAYSYDNRISKAVDALEGEQKAAGASMGFVEWYNLGNGFLTMQEFKSAANAFRQALRLNPGYAAAWNNLGTLEGMLGNNSAALDDYRRASALGDPLGGTNVARLQSAIAAAREARSDDPLKALWRSQNAELERRARQAWQDRLGAAQTN